MTNYFTLPGLMKGYSLKIKGSNRHLLIMQAVCQYYQMTTDEIAKRSRKREVVEARAMICYLLRKHTKLKLQDIGKLFTLHHTSVIHMVNRTENLLNRDKQVHNDHEQIMNLL